MKRLKRKRIRLTAVLLSATAAFLLLFQCFTPFFIRTVSAAGETTQRLEDGTYRIKNVGTGLYVTAQTYNSKKAAATLAILMKESDPSDGGQNFILKTAADGSRTMTPRNDSGVYCLSAPRPAEGDGSAVKTKDVAASCFFDVLLTDFGGYTIAPAYDSNLYSVLTPASYATGSALAVSDYAVGDRMQLWVFEPVEASTSLSVAYNNTKIRLYSTGKFYSRLEPYVGTDPADAEWSSSDSSVLLVGDDGSYSAIGTGSATVTARAEGLSASFTVKVVDSECFTWYSQNNIYTSDWNGAALTDLFMSSWGVRKRFAVNDDGHPAYASWMDAGCALCSIAQVLHNLGATMKTGYDMRTGQTDNLPADPFTVGLANTLNYTMYDKSKTYSGDPSYMYWKRVADAFEANGETICYRSVYTQNRNTIKKLLQAHPQGIIAQLQNRVRTHYVVIGQCVNPEEKTASKIEFLIYDPAAYADYDGDGVLMKDTTSYKYMSLGYYSISRLIIYDVESNYKN